MAKAKQRASVRWNDDEPVVVKTSPTLRKTMSEKPGSTVFNIERLDLQKLKKEMEQNVVRRGELIRSAPGNISQKPDENYGSSVRTETFASQDETYGNHQSHHSTKTPETNETPETTETYQTPEIPETHETHEDYRAKNLQLHNKYHSDPEVLKSRLVRANSVSRIFRANYTQATQESTGPCHLKDLILQFPCISGSILITNLSAHKQVFVRITTNNWRTFTDQPAKWVSTSLDGQVDEFGFEFGVSLEFFGTVEFAICYQTPKEDYWDNNEGRNYQIESITDFSPQPQPHYFLLPPASPRSHLHSLSFTSSH